MNTTQLRCANTDYRADYLNTFHISLEHYTTIDIQCSADEIKREIYIV